LGKNLIRVMEKSMVRNIFSRLSSDCYFFEIHCVLVRVEKNIFDPSCIFHSNT
jgi:hypothetical protein